MRRPRRHRWLTVSVFFIANSVFQAVYSPSKASEPFYKPADEVDAMIKEEAAGEVSTPSAANTPPTEKELAKSLRKLAFILNQCANCKDSETDELREKRRSEGMKHKPTVNPHRGNCSPPAIEHFPKPIMGQSARKHGGLLIYIFIAAFTFIGLAIVCNNYFVLCLDRICEELKLAPDVAGATFMAAGSSAPELATVVFGVTCAQDDIGVSGVIGSAIFNMMFVIALCALCAGTVSHLNWWPLCRDCFFYALSILVTLCAIANTTVYWPEAFSMLTMYVAYCVALHFNTSLEHWVMTLPIPFKLPTREEQAALVTHRSAGGQTPAATGNSAYAQMEGQTKETPPQNSPAYSKTGAYDNLAYNADPIPTWKPNHERDPNRTSGDKMQAPINTGPQPTDTQQQQQQHQQQQQAQSATGQQQQSDQQKPARPAVPTFYKAKEHNPETAIDPLVKPIEANHLQLAWWYLVYPIHWTCRHTMPDSRGRWYPLTFIISMVWISFYSYFMVWMITIIGYTLGIPDTVMGLTFVAAGVSVPDAFSSLAVLKEGYPDMAVANAVGSNVFDILVCLGLPWFMKTAIMNPGSYVKVYHKGLIYSTLSLFFAVIFLVMATHVNGWKLDRKYGVVLMVWYVLFITFASLYELNVFGYFTHPDCPSNY